MIISCTITILHTYIRLMQLRDFCTTLSKHLMEVKLFYQTKTAKLEQNLQRIEMCPNFEINVYFSKLKQLNEISL